jgi:lipoyl(octanoyl) transferase
LRIFVFTPPPIAIHDPEPHSAAFNMALDEALLLLSPTPVLRIYRWSQPSVSFGYFGRFAAVAAAWAGRELVRRMTGGGTVTHGEDITYTLTAPLSHPLAQMTARESYRVVHAALARWLLHRGISVSLAGSPSEQGNGACFESPVESDVLAAGRKLAGAAQRRTREGLLLQGSIQGVPLSWAAELPGVFGTVESRGFTGEELDLAHRLAAEKYGAPAWSERV